ncbi:MAG: DNA-directed RNA polymerase subunit omega [Planctomycetaceae bacterium]
MLEAFKEEEIVKKVGGRFKLSSLIQKRLVALNRGSHPLVDLPTKNLMEIVLEEIMQDKIYLDTSGQLATNDKDSSAMAPVETDAGPSLSDL